MKHAWKYGWMALVMSTGAMADLPEPLKTVVANYQTCANQVRARKEGATIADIKSGCASQDAAARATVPENIRDQFMSDLYLRLEAGAAI